MLSRIRNRIARLWRADPCVTCGAPSVGFAAEIRGKLLTKGADGQAATKYYIGGPRSMCARCLEAARAAMPRSAPTED